MNSFQIGLCVGALTKTPTWTLQKYKELAHELWKKAASPFAIVEITRDGSKFIVHPFTTKAGANDQYEASIADPKSFVYVAYFDRHVRPGEQPLIDEMFFQPTDIVEVRETVKTISTPVKAALGLGGALGLIALLAKH